MRPDDRRTATGAEHLIAGFDGSECSRHAAEWAAVEAEGCGAGLRLVYSVGRDHSKGKTRGRALLDDAVAGLVERHPSVPITAVLTDPPAAASLVDIADDALLTVVGSWGAGRAPGAPLGSVAFFVASTSRSPVVVVRPEHASSARRPVAVAMDGIAVPKAGLDVAFAAAQRRNVRLLVLHVRHDASIDGAFPYQLVGDTMPSAGTDPGGHGGQDAEGRAVMAHQLAPWQIRYPGVPVTPIVLFGSPTATLLDFSRRTDLLVIGDTGRGVNSGPFLGATGQSLLHRSGCPVVVARTPRPDT